MTLAAPQFTSDADLLGAMLAMGARAREASRLLSNAGPVRRTRALELMSEAILAASETILQANALDMTAGPCLIVSN